MKPITVALVNLLHRHKWHVADNGVMWMSCKARGEHRICVEIARLGPHPVIIAKEDQ